MKSFPKLPLVLSAIISLVALTAIRGDDLRATIDREIKSGWEQQKLAPASRSSDSQFLRRIYLDLVGTIPTHEEAVAFLDDPSPDKRTVLIDKLLADSRFAEHQADIWDLVLFTRNPPNSEVHRRDGMKKWLARVFTENVPYDQWVRAILKAEGNSVDEGAPLYLVQYRSRPEDASEAISQTFLGVQLQCARCHDHPFETWTQLDFYGMAAFLARLQVVSVGKEKDLTKYAIGEKNTGDILFTGPAKDQTAGKKGEPVKPKFLLASALDEPEVAKDFKEPPFKDNETPPAPMFSRKNRLAEWIASPENPYFAKAIANRVWAQYMGRGLVHPVDNMSASNAPSHPALLAELTKQMVEHKFDLKWFVREIVSSEAYQLSSIAKASPPLPIWHEYAATRPLSAEELGAAWKQATWYDRIEGLNKESEESRNRFHPLTGDYVVRFFGTPNTGTGDFQGGLQEHLYLNNGQLGSLTGERKGNLCHWLTTSQDPLEQRVERLFLSTLSRRPLPEETERFARFVEETPGQPRWSDAIWALITCGEFRFNH